MGQYALAATAFHLLTGSPPYQRSNPIAVIGQHLTAAPPKLSNRRPELASSTEHCPLPFPRTPSSGSAGVASSRTPSTSSSPAAQSVIVKPRPTSLWSPTPRVRYRDNSSRTAHRGSWRRIGNAVAAILAVLVIAATTSAIVHFTRTGKPMVASPPSTSPATQKATSSPAAK